MKLRNANNNLDRIDSESALIKDLIESLRIGIPLEKKIIEIASIWGRGDTNFFSVLTNTSRYRRIFDKIFREPETRLLGVILMYYNKFYSSKFIDFADHLREFLVEKARVRLKYYTIVNKMKFKIFLTIIALYVSSLFSILYMPELLKSWLKSTKIITDFTSLTILFSLAVTITYILNSSLIFQGLDPTSDMNIIVPLILISIYLIIIIIRNTFSAV